MNVRWALFVSGRGSNAQAVMDQLAELNLNLVVSSRSSVWGLARAKRHGIPTIVLDKKIDWSALQIELKRRKISHLFLLGFMKLIPAEFLSLWQNRIFNLHPSLLPLYPGLQAIEKSYADRAMMGVTVHHVIPEMDAGRKILQKRTSSPFFAKDLSLAEMETLISRDEQRLVRLQSQRVRC